MTNETLETAKALDAQIDKITAVQNTINAVINPNVHFYVATEEGQTLVSSNELQACLGTDLYNTMR
ncbi:MAG TPA: hypothetical protein PL045_03720, partial [Chitinophagaceae bacterium]|nr:hypothetical protein [Chitinophagaceae bacterium]